MGIKYIDLSPYTPKSIIERCQMDLMAAQMSAITVHVVTLPRFGTGSPLPPIFLPAAEKALQTGTTRMAWNAGSASVAAALS